MTETYLDHRDVARPPRPHDPAYRVLDLLRHIVPYESATITRPDVATGQQRTVAHVGTDPGRVRARAPHPGPCPLRWDDDADLGSMGERVSTCLHTADGRYAGSLHLGYRGSARPWRRAHVLAVLLEVRPLISALVDRPDGTYAALVRTDGSVVALSGRPVGIHLTSNGPLPLAIAAAHRGDELFERFLWRDRSAGWHAVETRVSTDGVLVNENACGLPMGLTTRELEVLTHLTGGYTNPQIGRLMALSDKTVAKHVEHLLEKLNCSSRSAAAAQAVRTGLIELALHTPGSLT